tara:strand:- start:101 stop:403 length:303 start_codon:yes stop_codon:yes gene_type:complete
MGNICEIFSKNNKYQDDPKIRPLIIGQPLHNKNDISNNIPICSPLYMDDLPSYNELYLHNNQQRPQVIVVGHNPYYNDHGTSMMTGFLGGMLMEDILDTN